jgi:hypothetical protein
MKYFQLIKFANLMIAILILGINLLTASWLPLHGDIYFHTDIARDFLLIDEVLQTHKLTLIGARAGGIPGVYYGPLWLYLNLPMYYLSGGNPVIIGWFWVGLFISGSIIFFLISRQLLGKHLSIWATVLYTTILSSSIPNSIAHLGAVLLCPVWFYALVKFINKPGWLFLVGSYFILGLMVHFQVAFAGPMIVIQTSYLVYYLSKLKKMKYLLSIFVLVIPLATYILFELRHNFLQFRAVVSFLTSNHPQTLNDLEHFFLSRMSGLFMRGMGLFPGDWQVGSLILITGLIFLSRGKQIGHQLVIWLFGLFYVGFWLITFLFKGEVWGYYYWPFIPLSILCLFTVEKMIKKTYVYFIVLIMISINLISNIRWLSNLYLFTGKHESSWKFQQLLAQKIYAQAPADFGYYIYTPDQYGYSPRYAMLYTQKEYPHKRGHFFTKKSNTYLIMAADAPENPYISRDNWRRDKVKIVTTPTQEDTYSNGYLVQKFNLSQEQMNIEADQNLIHDLFFR